FFAICIRGDRQINLTKVASFLQVDDCELASEEEILKHLHVEKGFIGPLYCPIPCYADETTRPMTNFICANNQKDVHCKHVNWGRDIPLPAFGDFLLAEAGDLCPQNGGAPYEIFQGVEVAHIFNLGTRYTESFSVGFQDKNGDKQLCWMGTYGIGVGRTLAACIEQLADNKGLVWPLAVTPFSITILYNGGDTEGEATALQLYQSLNTEGFEPLLDDRNERLGFKLKDSDLLGIPYKLIIGKSFQSTGLLEIESRSGEKCNVSPENLLDWCSKNLPCHTRKIPPLQEQN
ncbi:YbaK/EbsC family protein, partial [Chlamydia trachomatis]